MDTLLDVMLSRSRLVLCPTTTKMIGWGCKEIDQTTLKVPFLDGDSDVFILTKSR